MNTGYAIERQGERQSPRWPELIRFLSSALGIWAACATGIYLIGPAEPEVEAAASAPAHALAGHRIPVASYEP